MSCHVTWPLPTSRPLPRMTPPHPAVHLTCSSPPEQLVHPRAVTLCSANTQVKALLPRDGHERTSVLPDFSHTNRPIFVLFLKSECVLCVLFCNSISCLVTCLGDLCGHPQNRLTLQTTCRRSQLIHSLSLLIDTGVVLFLLFQEMLQQTSLFTMCLGLSFHQWCLLGVTESTGL